MQCCKGVNLQGAPCGIDPRFVNQETGFCPAHDPVTGAAYMAGLGRKSAERAASRRSRKSVKAAELGELETLEDAKRWLKIIGQAACTGRLSDRAAQAGIRAVSEWCKADSDASAAAMYQDLKGDLARVREQVGNRGRPLRSIRGDA